MLSKVPGPLYFLEWEASYRNKRVGDSMSSNNENRLAGWQLLKQQVLSEYLEGYVNSYTELNYYSLVYTPVDDEGKPLLIDTSFTKADAFFIFTDIALARRMEEPVLLSEVRKDNYSNGLLTSEIKLKPVMLGELIETLKSNTKPTPIKVNPVLVSIDDKSTLMCEEVVFSPAFDSFTGKLLMTDFSDARALLAVDARDQNRFGIELVFYMVTNRSILKEGEERGLEVRQKIEELAFLSSRIPMKRGSGTFIIVVLNLENEIEEQAFIRDYKTFDDYSNVLFVTSSLRLLTGHLKEIHYNGDSIDTIFMPMIEWQKKLLK